MFTRVKTPVEIEHIRRSGQILASVLKLIDKSVVPGMTGKDISNMVVRALANSGAKAAFKGYMDFPDVICISVNDTVVHGIPNDKPFQEGDLVGFDFGVNYKGMITDSAFTKCIGESPSGHKKVLLDTTRRALYAGIDRVKDGVKTGDIANAIEQILLSKNLGIVRELVGHGVGHHVHEEPNIPNYGTAGSGPKLKSGMTIAIEPMAMLGKDPIYQDKDGWGIKSLDGSLTAHFEHTILITDKGCEVLTEW